MPKIIKTTLSLVVYHAADTAAAERLVADMTLADIAHFITDGDGIGAYTVVAAEEIAPVEVEAELLKIGNDGSFFAQDVADLYFPAHLRADDESQQHWTVKVDQEADALFRTLSEADIRKRQDICRQQAKQAHEQGHDRAALDIARNEEALMREMLRRC
ncbi:hypothetical protein PAPPERLAPAPP_01550 [Brevundimonas phage vB_BpoS-Papperlapapp]|nr:hypothetical protein PAPPERLAPAPP_01550 [Brevundimonas phage vB_BpoS-Papperlapapp]